MKKLIFLVALAMAGTAWAQPQKDAPKPEAAKPAPAAPVSPAKVAAVPKPATVAKKSKRTQDARHCLQRSGNTEIIKCAEEFL